MSKNKKFEPNNILGWTEEDFAEVIHDHAKASMNGCLPLTVNEMKALTNFAPSEEKNPSYTDLKQDLIVALENIIWLCNASPSIEQIKIIAKDILLKLKKEKNND